MIWNLSALIASVVALLTAVAWLQLEAAAMAGDWSAALDVSVIGTVLSDTEFGHAWAAHLVLAAALVAVVILVGARPLGGDIARFGGAAGEPRPRRPRAMQTGAEGVLHRLNHAVHLLAAGAWLGGLIAFAMCLQAYDRDDLRRDAVQAMMSFSFWGQLVVAAIILTGLVNIALTSGHPPIPPTTPYRALLLAKLGIVGIMIALAVFNRFFLAPQLKSSPARSQLCA